MMKAPDIPAMIGEVLSAFWDAQIMVSISVGPDGASESVGMPYQHISGANEADLARQMVTAAHEEPSVIIELRSLPVMAGGLCHVNYTIRNFIPTPTSQ